MNFKPRYLPFLLLVAMVAEAQTDSPRLVTERYENSAEGFAVTLPETFVGLTGNQAGPQRGFTILLPSKGTITISGEPNSLEYRSPEEAVRQSLSYVESSCKKRVRVSATTLGGRPAARGSFACGDRSLTQVSALSPSGAQLYSVRLESFTPSDDEDRRALQQIVGGFVLTDRK